MSTNNRTIPRSLSMSSYYPHNQARNRNNNLSIPNYDQDSSNQNRPSSVALHHLNNNHDLIQPQNPLTIASLDLSSSLPLALASLRNYLLDRLELLEDRLKHISRDQRRGSDRDVCCISSSDDDDEEEEEEEEDEEDEEEEAKANDQNDASEEKEADQGYRNNRSQSQSQTLTPESGRTQATKAPSVSGSKTRSSSFCAVDQEQYLFLSSGSSSNLQEFLHQVSNYVTQLKSDLFSSDLSNQSTSLTRIDPGLIQSSSQSSLILRAGQPRSQARLRHTISIPDPQQLARSLIFHSQNIQEVLSQLTVSSNYPLRLSDLPFMTFSVNESTESNHQLGRSEWNLPSFSNPSQLRKYFASESERLASLLPAIPTALSESFAQSSNQITSALRAYKEEAQAALHDGEMFIREEGEKLKDWVDSEAESLRLALQAGASRLLTYHELPPEWKNNQFIIGGYRFIPLDRWRDLLLSGLQWHNETINIHTHFFGTLSLIYLLCFLWPTTAHTDPASSTLTDRLISLTFVMCAIKCLVCSTAWHLFAGCGTLGPFRRLACVDYVGISGLIAASVVSAEYYGFYCRPELAARYIAFTAIMGVIGMILPFQPFFDRPESKGIRIVFFVSMACSFLIPQAHMSYLYGFRETINFYKPAFPSVISYLGGLFFYASNWPERIRPGWVFDTLFHSHQFWHVAIVIAIWLHWRAIGFLHDVGREGFSCSATAVGGVGEGLDYDLIGRLRGLIFNPI